MGLDGFEALQSKFTTLWDTGSGGTVTIQTGFTILQSVIWQGTYL